MQKIMRHSCIRLSSVCLMLFMVFTVTYIVNAQKISYEFWPETDIWYRLSPEWRLSCYLPITKYNESKYRDLNIYLQADYAWGKTKNPFYKRLMDENKEQKIRAWMVRLGFMEGWSLGENSGSYTEDMIYAEIHKRVPLKGAILFSQRFRTDTRWVGEEPKFSYRFRYRMMIEKEYETGKYSVVPYVNIEPFWDSRYNTISRIRGIGGVTVLSGGHFAYEGNITYQYDEHYDTNNLFAFNLILHVFIETKNDVTKKVKNY